MGAPALVAVSDDQAAVSALAALPRGYETAGDANFFRPFRLFQRFSGLFLVLLARDLAPAIHLL